MIRNSNYYTRRRDGLIRRLSKIKPFISGSIAVVERACGNPNCRCRKGEKHVGYYLLWKKKKKTTGLYIPIDLKEEVEKWNEEYRLLKSIIQEINELQRTIIRGYVKEKRGRAKHARKIR